MSTSMWAELEFKNEHGVYEWAQDLSPNAIDSNDYQIFGWLADIRNYACVPLLDPKFGKRIGTYPDDMNQKLTDEFSDHWDCYNHIWYSLEQLTNFDYEQTFEDRRPDVGGTPPLPIGQGDVDTYRNHFCPTWFEQLAKLNEQYGGKDARLYFCFG